MANSLQALSEPELADGGDMCPDIVAARPRSPAGKTVYPGKKMIPEIVAQLTSRLFEDLVYAPGPVERKLGIFHRLRGAGMSRTKQIQGRNGEVKRI